MTNDERLTIDDRPRTTDKYSDTNTAIKVKASKFLEAFTL